MVNGLTLPSRSVERLRYYADQRFFRPLPEIEEPDLVCSAGMLLRDYDTLISATSGLPIRVSIAAGSPWEADRERPSHLPGNIEWRRRSRFDLRALYARSALAVVPLLENGYQSGIATIMEMMAMGKCVIASRTRGQTDTIVDGVTGVYVPPGDPHALRRAITGLLADPAARARIGGAAREFVEREASFDIHLAHLARIVREGHADHVGHQDRGSPR